MRRFRFIALAIYLWSWTNLQAASILVNLGTAGLPAGNYGLDLQLLDGDGVINNSVTFQNFTFTGLAVNSLSLSGTASGSTVTAIAISDGNPSPDPFSGALQSFTVSSGPSSIQLEIVYSGNFAGGFPDTVSLALLDSSLTALAWLTLDLGTPAFLTTQPGGGVTLNTSFDVPEPSLPWIAALGIMLAVSSRGRANAKGRSR
ncbi:MAG: hypothetical protein K2X03_25265 [Bryobacteraceae bacterium]|nr:hypothetical protein [Bryobacteraceae bacterium]